MTEEAKDEPTQTNTTKKIWRVMRNIPAPRLEGVLNEVALEGYQVFRIDRFTRPHPQIEDHELPWYDVVVFNPILIGELHHAGMAAMLTKAAEGLHATAGGQSVSGPVG